MNYLGTGVALVTPFNEDGSVDYVSMKKLIEHVISGGVEYLVAMGTTAEVATLNPDEKEELINFIVETNAGRLPIVLGLGGNNTAAIVNEIKSRDLSAFSAILSVSPFYNKPTQEGIYAHYAAISEACPIDIILYNVPGRTASNIEVSTVVKLANNFDNIVAIKEAAGSLDQAMSLIKEKPEGFHIISGDDAQAMPITLLGGSGVISVLGQGLPEDFSEMIRFALNKDVMSANTIQFRVLDMVSLIFAEGNPAGVKALLKKRGICSEFVRLPLISASENLTSKIGLNYDSLYLYN